MFDYYSGLLRAVTAPDAGDARWRRNLYDRARQVLATQLRAKRPSAPLAEIAAEQAALEAAIERIESELSVSGPETTTADDEVEVRSSYGPGGNSPGDSGTSETWAEPERGPIAETPRWRASAWLVLAVVAAALGAGGYIFWAGKAQKSAPAMSKTETAKTAPQPTRVSRTKDGDLAPGIDGGSTDPEQPYVFRRQSTFYRTLQPAGTIIVDKLQHFLYLIQPNNVALRYGIGVGQHCADLAGLHRIASKAEWPQWQPPPDMIARKLAQPGTLPGGPGNPLGARVMDLDDGKSNIHGTNAPKTIGNSLTFGCIRLVNDDVVDLYNRVQVSTPVIAGD